MATRFEGKVNVTNLVDLGLAAQQMSDHQLDFYAKVFKNRGLVAAHDVILHEMGQRVADQLLLVFLHNR